MHRAKRRWLGDVRMYPLLVRDPALPWCLGISLQKRK